MKTGIIGVLNNPAISMNSHSAGMVNIVKSLFNSSILDESLNWNDYDELIIYHGVNFKPGSFNVIGGLTKDVYKRADLLANFKGKIKSLDGFQLNEFSIKRKLNLYDNHKTFELTEIPDKDNLVVGDSHSISVWPDESYTISRNDGKTLYGFLKQNRDLSRYKNIIFYFGNIDLRFHLARQSDPKQATIDLFNRYFEYCSRYNSTITMLLPLESESRVIPKSGQYKGKNYFGSLELRKELRFIANSMIKESGFKYLEWPSTILDDEGNLSFEVMEPKQSVHIRPKFYMNQLKKQLRLF